ncbi:uncharacterized protein [Apostichopus japonicus]|uniref:uncharacterized protein n=1 Tax=Stichopus japonicus TaxID=307972 RepID=UPI003AB7E47C
MPPNSTPKDDKHCNGDGEKCTGGEKCGGSRYIAFYVNIAYRDGPVVVTTVTGISAFILGCLIVIGVQCDLRIGERFSSKLDKKISDNTPGMMISFINDSLSNEQSMDNFIKDTPQQPSEYLRVT